MTAAVAEGAAPGEVPSPRAGYRSRWLALAFLFPALLLLGALVLYPILFSIVRSLYDSSGSHFRGLGNYGDMFTSKQTLTSIRNNAIWVIVAPTVVTALGLVFAVLTERIRWTTAFKLLIFMPMAVSFLASGIIFRLVYDQDPDKGVANAIVVAVHDVFVKSSAYPGARPRDATVLATQGKELVSAASYSPGDTALLGLVGYNPTKLPKSAEQAVSPATQPGVLSGAVWLDFATGGGGKADAIDPGEKALPGVKVQAWLDGKEVATATTSSDGSFAFTNLADGSYTLRLPHSNFTAPFNGITWLGPTLITPSIIASYVWMWAGFAMVLIAAGLAAISREALEAARVDGATEFQVFRKVTMPLLSPVLIVVLVTLVINVLKIFDLVLVIAPGSVQADANVLALQMWTVSFGGGNNQGLGSALGVFLFLLVLPAMIFNIRRFRREQQ